MAPKKKVLIIDDDSRNIFALTAVLSPRGFDCIAASGAMEGINLLNEDSNIGIVLMDMMMPDMDGYEAKPVDVDHLTGILNQHLA